MFIKIYYTILTLTVIFYVLPGDEAKQLPDVIKKCGRKDPDFNECMRNASETVMKIWDDLPPEFNLPSINPIKIDKLQLKRKSDDDFDFSAKYNNLEISGLKNIQASEFTGDLENGFHAKGFLQQYNVKSDYEIAGKLLLFQFKGRGVGNMTLKNVTCDISLYFKQHKNDNDGQEYIKIKNAKIKLTPQKIEVKINNNPSDINPEISKLLETALNDNAKELWYEFEPVFNKKSTETFVSYINQFISDIPVKDLFLN